MTEEDKLKELTKTIKGYNEQIELLEHAGIEMIGIEDVTSIMNQVLARMNKSYPHYSSPELPISHYANKAILALTKNYVADVYNKLVSDIVDNVDNRIDELNRLKEEAILKFKGDRVKYMGEPSV